MVDRETAEVVGSRKEHRAPPWTWWALVAVLIGFVVTIWATLHDIDLI
jgi:hypothetical protein